MKNLRLPFTAAAVSALLLIAGCNPIGNGIGPVSLVTSSATTDPATGRASAYRCLPTQMVAILNFSDGSSGDFSARARWSSSNPGVIAVSNGDIPVPGSTTNGVYPPGTLIASNTETGSAVITASFSGLTSNLNVDAAIPTDFQVVAVDSISGLFSPLPANGMRMAPATAQDFTVTASLGGITQNVEGAVRWAFDNPNTAVATIAPDTGVISAVATGGPLVNRATFSSCGESVASSIRVQPAQSIVVQPEFVSNGLPADLIVPNSELFRAFADFGDGPEQDVSLPTVFTGGNATIAVFNTGIGATSTINSIAAGGPLTINASFAQTNAPLAAPPFALTTVTGTLQSIAIEPATASLIAGSSDVQVFHVIGTYADGRTQDISRIAAWTSSDVAIANVTAGVITPGQVRSTSRTTGTVTITATIPTSSTVTAATAQLTTTPVPAAP